MPCVNGLNCDHALRIYGDWARVKLDDPTQWELPERPDGIEEVKLLRTPTYPADILVTPDGRGVIGCSADRITLFRW